MARRKVTFSGKNSDLHQTFTHHNDVSDSLNLFFSDQSPFYESRFLGLKSVEVDQLLLERLEELDLTTTMSILAAVEAAFRIDYLKRSYRKKRDVLSRQFRVLYLKNKERVSLEDEIFEVWKKNTDQPGLIGELRGAFRFRHWLAHGRFWEPKLGRKYDLTYVYQLALAAVSLPLET